MHLFSQNMRVKLTMHFLAKYALANYVNSIWVSFCRYIQAELQFPINLIFTGFDDFCVHVKHCAGVTIFIQKITHFSNFYKEKHF